MSESAPTPPSATHLIADQHASSGDLDEWKQEVGACCFCGVEEEGVLASDAISREYFSDDPLMQAHTGHLCFACAYCMNQRELKNGHWIAASNRYERISTSDLPDHFDQLQAGDYEPPVAVHLTASPIRSSHAYLWTPVREATDPLGLDFDRETVTIRWGELDRLVRAVEDCRWNGFTFTEIRSGEPRVSHLEEMGVESYRRAEGVIEPHRRTAALEVALTLSKSADNQSRPRTNDGNATLDNYA